MNKNNQQGTCENWSKDSDEELVISEMIYKKQNKTLKVIGLVFSKQTCTPASFSIVIICYVPPKWITDMNGNSGKGNVGGSQTWGKMVHLTRKGNANQNYSST